MLLLHLESSHILFQDINLNRTAWRPYNSSKMRRLSRAWTNVNRIEVFREVFKLLLLPFSFWIDYLSSSSWSIRSRAQRSFIRLSPIKLSPFIDISSCKYCEFANIVILLMNKSSHCFRLRIKKHLILLFWRSHRFLIVSGCSLVRNRLWCNIILRSNHCMWACLFPSDWREKMERAWSPCFNFCWSNNWLSSGEHLILRLCCLDRLLGEVVVVIVAKTHYLGRAIVVWYWWYSVIWLVVIFWLFEADIIRLDS